MTRTVLVIAITALALATLAFATLAFTALGLILVDDNRDKPMPGSSSAAWDSRSAVMSAMGSGSNRLDSIAFASQHVYGIGLYNGAIAWGALNTSSSRPYATYILKTTFRGTPVWLQSIDTGAESSPFPRIAVQSDVYIAGTFSGNVSFGGIWLNSSSTVHGPVQSVYLARIAQNGTWVWARAFTGNRLSMLSDMRVDGHIRLIVNTRAQTLTFEGHKLWLAGGTLRPTVWTVNTNGAVISAIAAGNSTTDDDRANALAYANGVTYIAGGIRGNARFGNTVLASSIGDSLFVAATDGAQWLWAVSGNNTDDDFWANGLSTHGGNLYVVGLYEGVANMGPLSLTSRGGRDLLVSSLTINGTWNWASSVGSTLNDYASAVSTTIDSVFVTGGVRGNVTFGQYGYTTNQYTEQIFIANMSPEGAYRWVLGSVKIQGNQTEGLCIANYGRRFALGGFYGGSMQIGTTTLPYSPHTTSFLVISLDVETLGDN